jgi:hypothetical protein
MKNAVFWDVKPCGSCKKRSIASSLMQLVFLRGVLQFLVTAEVVPSSQILFHPDDADDTLPRNVGS